MKACRLNPNKTKLLCESGTLKTANEILARLFDSVSVFTQWMNQLKTSVLNHKQYRSLLLSPCELAVVVDRPVVQYKNIVMSCLRVSILISDEYHFTLATIPLVVGAMSSAVLQA
jgi:hypothetical protein